MAQIHRPTICSVLFFGLVFLLAGSLQAEVTLFGPELYVRHTGKPVAITHGFNNPFPSSDFILKIQNGEPGGPPKTQVTSAVVWLNSIQVLGPSDFKRKKDDKSDDKASGKDKSKNNGKNVEIIEIPVTLLEGENTIAVELRGKPGSHFALSISSSINSPPVADAGPDQTVSIGEQVQLDGSGSTDVDGDALTYSWFIVSQPVGSLAVLSDPSSVTPTFVADIPGDFVIDLLAHDGLDERSDTVVISTDNSVPVADAGPDQTVALGALVQLNGSGSMDADNHPLNYDWSLTSVPASSAASLDSELVVNPVFVADLPGSYTAQLVINDGYQDSDPDSVQIDTLNSQPVAVAGPDQEVFVGATVALDGSASSDADGDALSFQWALLTTPDGSGATVTDADQQIASFVPDLAGIYVAQLIVRDGQLDSDPDTAMVTVEVQVVLDSDEDGLSDAQEAILGTNPNDSDSDDDGLNDGEEVNTHGTDPLKLDSDEDGYTDKDEIDAGTDPVDLSSYPIGVPRNPLAIAPPIDPTVATTTYAGSQFLYTGSNPIQTGVLEETIDTLRTAVLRGRVMTRDGAPLSGVTITILGHPEYGQTISRVDGVFDMVVNGGGYFTINYAKDEFLSAQRQVKTPWQDSVWAPDALLTQLDAKVTTVALSAGEIQVARGSEVTDADGTRQATLLVPPATTAELVLPDGTTQPAGSLSIRVTEYTVGPNGPQAMPAELPPTSGYTYAVELSADEAISAGATDVRFNQPIVYYVEDFIGFPVGSSVPAGFYDRTKGQWIASQNGRVIKVLGVTGGLADLDTDGDGVAGPYRSWWGDIRSDITDAERQDVAGLYPVGQVLWRVQIDHFTPWDFNWPYGPPEGATAGDGEEPRGGAGEDVASPCEDGGFSVIECQNQILGEQIGIVGTPFTLNYRSDRMPGRLTARTLEIPLLGDVIPPGLVSIRLNIIVAGQRHVQTLFPAPGLTHTFTWDGRDAYGRELQGPQPAQVKIGYRYQPVYYSVSADFESSFGVRDGTGDTVPGREGSMVTLNRGFIRTVGNLDTRGQGLGGWTLNVHHVYDPVTRTLYRGDGGRQTADQSVPFVIDTIAGTGESGYNGDDRPAVEAQLASPIGIAFGPDGSLYVADTGNNRIRKITPDGFISTVAGNGARGFEGGDFGLAADARLNSPNDITVAPDNTLYIADTNNLRIRKVAPDGIITTVAGNGRSQACYEGSPATESPLYWPTNVALGPSGSVYLSSSITLGYICEVGTDNILHKIADCCGDLERADGIPAVDAWVYVHGQLAVGPDESLYFGDGNFSHGGLAVRQITPDGLIYTLAGNYTNCSASTDDCGDGGPAQLAQFSSVRTVALDVDGSLYVRDESRIRRVAPDGTISTVAGTGEFCNSVDPSFPACGDGGPATEAKLYGAAGIAVGPDGSVYLSDGNRIRVLRRAQPGATDAVFSIPSRAGDELYQFDVEGRHVKTLNMLTGTVRYEFTYENGVLTQVVDGDNNATQIRHDGDGDPTSIVGPYNQTTILGTNRNGYLDRITNPANESYSFGYSDDGLLERTTNPRNFASTYFYDTLGRLKRANDPAGGSTTLVRTELSDGYQVTKTSALGRTTTYRVERLPNGDQLFTNVFPSGEQVTLLLRTDGSTLSNNSDGTEISVQEGPDPRFGMQAPIVTSLEVTTPSGLTSTLSRERTVDLTDPDDILSLERQTDTITINGHDYTEVADVVEKQWTVITPIGRRIMTKFDSKERATEMQIADLEPISLAYDTRDRLSSMTLGFDPDGREFLFSYGDDGFIAQLTDPIEQWVSIADRDAAGRVTQTIRSSGRETSFTYDANGNVSSVTPPGRPSHRFSYNKVDQAEVYSPPDVGSGSNSTVFAYNRDRDLTAITRADGTVIQFGYNPGGLLATAEIPRGMFSYTYDSNSALLTAITAPDGGRLDFDYDGGLDTGVTWTGEVSGRVEQQHNNDFQLASRSINSELPVNLFYDDDGLLTSAGSLVVKRDQQSGLIDGTTLANVADVYGYNGFGEMETYTARFNETEISALQYTRDPLGRITKITETIDGIASTYSYSYDDAGRLTEVKHNGGLISTYRYDDNGNRLFHNEVMGDYDDEDRLLQYGTARFNYTANGELQTKTNESGTTTYVYDAFGNLMSVALPNGSSIEYLVDGLNRRIGKNVNGTLVQGFLYKDRLNPIAELDGSGAVVSRFVYASKSNVPDYMVKGGNTYRIISNHLGSPRLVINVTTGTVVQKIDYDEFGNVLADTNPGFQPFGFAGGLYDKDTKLIRFGARDYDAAVGRWTTKDPILFDGGDTNLYRYVLSDPVNMIDPSGHALLGLLTIPAVIARPAVLGIAAAVPEVIDFVASFANEMGVINLRPGWGLGSGVGGKTGDITGRAVNELFKEYKAYIELQSAQQLSDLYDRLIREQQEREIRQLMDEIRQLLYGCD